MQKIQVPYANTLLETMTGALVVLDRELKVSFLNPAAEALLETSGARAIGQAVDTLFSADFELGQSVDEAARKNQPFVRRSTKLFVPGGKTLTVDFALSLTETDDNVLIELQALDRLLSISREENLHSEQLTTRSIIQGMAHEIKNPLGGIRGAAQLMEKQIDDRELLEYTTVIIEEADRLRNLIDRMLGPRQALNIRETNIHEVLERVCVLIQAESDIDIKISRDYDPSIPAIMGDMEQLIQAILNIMRNAMQALQSMPPEHQGELKLRTRIVRQFTINKRRHPLIAKIDIIDNGPGIKSELLDKVFYPMVTDGANKQGLGLSIAQTILDRHQGLINCQSTAGCTEFSFFIPLERVND